MKPAVLFFFCLFFSCFAGEAQKKKQPKTFNPQITKGSKLDTIHVQGFKPREAVQVIEHPGTNPLILDIRTPDEFKTGHIKGALNIPLDQLELRIKELKSYKKQTIITVGETSPASMQACGILNANKFEWAFYLKTGLEGWRKEQLPLEK